MQTDVIIPLAQGVGVVEEVEVGVPLELAGVALEAAEPDLVQDHFQVQHFPAKKLHSVQ